MRPRSCVRIVLPSQTTLVVENNRGRDVVVAEARMHVLPENVAKTAPSRNPSVIPRVVVDNYEVGECVATA